MSGAAEGEVRAASARGDAALSRRLLAYLAARPLHLALALAIYPLNALCVVLPPYITQQILDRAIGARSGHLLALWVACYAGALLAEYVTGFASEYAMSALGQRAMHSLRRDLFAHVQRLSSAYFDRTPAGRVLTRLTSDVEALADVFSTGAITIIGDVLTVAAVVGMMLLLDVRLTLCAFLVMPPLTAVAVVCQRLARRAFRAIRRHLAGINAALGEFIGAMDVVQVFGQQRRVQAEFEALNAAYRDANRQAIFCDAALFAIVEAIGTTAVAAILWYGAPQLAGGVLSAGTLVAFIQYIRRFFVPIRDLSTKYTVLQGAFAGAERAFGLLDTPVEVVPPRPGRPVAGLRRALALEGVWFSYAAAPTTPHDFVLRGVDLHVARGERVALVGATGSGKSTVLRLMNRLYDVQRGAVRLDGEDVRTLDLPGLRRLFAVVQQDVHLFSGTLMDNLACAARISEDAVRRAVAAVQAEALVARQPQGYATPVLERGANFSAGERQLLALARALALDPEILVLDEATSSVDSATEAQIQAALDVVLRGRTAVVVAHRLSTVQKVDRIVVLEHGVVRESGSHAALMAADGLYRGLVDKQLAAAGGAG